MPAKRQTGVTSKGPARLRRRHNAAELERGARTDPDVKSALELWAGDKRATAAGIHRALERQFEPGIISLKTVQAMVKRARQREPSEPWSLVDATAEEAAAVLPALGELLRSSAWHEQTLTRDEAAWIVKLRRSVPDLPAAHSLRLARQYLGRIAAGDDTADLDRALASGTWQNLEAALTAGEQADQTRKEQRGND